MIDVNREDLVVMMEAGYVYLGMQRFTEARKVFEGVSVLAQDSEVPLIALGQVDFCEGKFSKAISKYKKALKMDPESVHAIAYMAEALFFDGENDEAIKLFKEVINFTFNNTEYLRSSDIPA